MSFDKSAYMRLGIVIVFLLPSVLFLSSLNKGYSQSIYAAEKRLYGLTYNAALFDFMISLQEFRGVNNMHVAYTLNDKHHHSSNDNEHIALEDKIATIVGSLERQKAVLSRLSHDHEDTLNIGLQWDILSAEYDAMMQNALELSQSRDFKKVTSIIDKTVTFINYVSITSGLVLDDSAQRHYITELNINILPRVSELFARVRGLGVGYITSARKSKSIDENLLAGLHQAYINMEQDDATFNRTMQTIFIYNNAFKRRLLQDYRSAVLSDRAFDDAVEDLIEDNSSVDEHEFFDIGTIAIQGLVDVYHQATGILDEDLQNLIDDTRFTQNVLNGFSGLALVLILFVISSAVRDAQARKAAEEALTAVRKFNEHIVAGTPGLISSVAVSYTHLTLP
ncbi:MAG: hypothetical protein KUG67_03000, partial [Proteobacteria bacterium]|nr:hypothetical protein [Pseudomonadota bacterium]